MELINPVSVYSGATPTAKESKHLFLPCPPLVNFCETGRELGTWPLKWLINWPNGLKAVYKSGIFPAMRPILVLKFPAKSVSILRVARCPHRLYGLPPKLLPAAQYGF